jgi:hypothetical protein
LKRQLGATFFDDHTTLCAICGNALIEEPAGDSQITALRQQEFGNLGLAARWRQVDVPRALTYASSIRQEVALARFRG